jgi:hypothetical protein
MNTLLRLRVIADNARIIWHQSAPIPQNHEETPVDADYIRRLLSTPIQELATNCEFWQDISNPTPMSNLKSMKQGPAKSLAVKELRELMNEIEARLDLTPDQFSTITRLMEERGITPKN